MRSEMICDEMALPPHRGEADLNAIKPSGLRPDLAGPSQLVNTDV